MSQLRKPFIMSGLATLGVLSSLLLASPALAAEPVAPVIISPQDNGFVELIETDDGTLAWQVSYSSEGSTARVWSIDSDAVDVDAARARLDQYSTCVQGVKLAYINQFATWEAFQATDEDPAEDTWQVASLAPGVAACAESAEFETESYVASTVEIGITTLTVPYNEMGAGTHALVLFGLGRPENEQYDPTCSGRTWDNGGWAGAGCDFTYAVPVYLTLNVPFLPSPDAQTLPGPAVTENSAFDQTIFSGLPATDNAAVVGPSAPLTVSLTVVLALVLAILIALPTELLNSAVSANHGRIAGVFRWMFPSRAAAPAAGLGALPQRRSPFVALFRGVSRWWALPVLLLAAAIASFSEPDIGVNWMSLRLVITLFVSFLIVNLGGTFLAWTITRKHTGLERPRLRARPIYLVIIAVTVLSARTTGIDPTLIFGTVLAIDYGMRLSKSRSAAVTIVGAAYALLLGIGSWLGYSALARVDVSSFAWSSLDAQWSFLGYKAASFAQVSLGELASVLTVEALSTIPIVLLPLAFLSGAALWTWKRSVWVVVYAIGLAAYSFVLVPLPISWSEISEPLVVWIGVFVAYAIFAVAVWALFYFTRNRHSRGAEKRAAVAAAEGAN
jgi:hypothetical protein